MFFLFLDTFCIFPENPLNMAGESLNTESPWKRENFKKHQQEDEEFEEVREVSKKREALLVGPSY